jgi:hypothetical protein
LGNGIIGDGSIFAGTTFAFGFLEACPALSIKASIMAVILPYQRYLLQQ